MGVIATAVIGVMVVGLSARVAEPAGPVAVPARDPEAEPVVPELDPGAGLPVPGVLDMSRDELEVAMHQLLDDTLAAAQIDDPEIPDDLVFPLTYTQCEVPSFRASVEVWFATADNAAAVGLVRDYWTSLGYSVLSNQTQVAAAGREPLVGESLDLAIVEWDDENLRLSLTSACVLDQ